MEIARGRRVTLRFTPDEADKHGIELAPVHRDRPRARRDDVDLCVVLGGDGTILTALRRYAGTGVPVFAVNYGEVGFLATIDPNGLERGLRARVRGRVRHDRAADDLGRPPRRHLERAQRHLRAPQGGPARGRPRVRARGRGDRPRPLRRARGRDAAGIHGLQPGQRRTGAGVGRRGLRRLIHRSALADGPRTGRRADRRADDQQRVARGAGRGPRRRPARRSSSRRARTSTSSSASPTARSPSSRARRSTTACASASAGSRARRATLCRLCASLCAKSA